MSIINILGDFIEKRTNPNTGLDSFRMRGITMNKPMNKAKVKQLLASLASWRRRLIDENEASESTDFWNEEEFGDDTDYKAIRCLIKHGPEVSRGFVVNSARAMHVEPDALRICLEEAGVAIKAKK